MRQSNAGERYGELELHEALAAGDEGAYHRFVRTHRPGLMRLAGELLGDGDVAEEVVQDTFEAVVKDIGGFRGDASLKTWTYRILVNRARRVGRRENRTVAYSDLGSVHDTGASNPQTEAINRQRLQILADGLRRLPERQREIVVLRDLEGHESGEVAEMLKITPVNQRVLLHRGRAALRAELELRDSGGPHRAPGTPLWN